MDAFAHVFAIESLIETIDSAETFRSVIKVMLADRKLSWGRVVIICEVALLLVHKFPHQREDILQVMSDAFSISRGVWSKL